MSDIRMLRHFPRWKRLDGFDNRGEPETDPFLSEHLGRAGHALGPLRLDLGRGLRLLRGPAWGHGKAALGKRVAGVALGSPVAVSGGIAAGTWYDVKLEFVGTTIKAYVGGTLLLTQTDTSCDAGSVGVGSVGASFEADDVRVIAPATCVQDWRDTTCGAFCTYAGARLCREPWPGEKGRRRSGGA